jgi:hypothetical protein
LHLLVVAASLVLVHCKGANPIPTDSTVILDKETLSYRNRGVSCAPFSELDDVRSKSPRLLPFEYNISVLGSELEIGRQLARLRD